MTATPQRNSPSPVVVVIGVGGMGRAIARRLGSGNTVVIADVDEETVHGCADALSAEGHQVHPHVLDVSSADAVHAFATQVSTLGEVTQIAHTAGLSPSQAPAALILAVDLLGAALVLEEFADVIAPHGAGVIVASMAAHLVPPLAAHQHDAIANAHPTELLTLPFLSPNTVTDPRLAYAIAKQAVLTRVRLAASAWGRRNARINSISPGTIATPMGHHGLTSAAGNAIRALITASVSGRMGTPDDIAAATAFLLGPDARFITGTDLLVDGGVTAAARTGAGFESEA
jgi:NAD(P)-dependent dehydrogenase (short-subunit alcohol dehydrogenase family)